MKINRLVGLSEALFAVIPMETIKVKFIHDQQLANPKFKGFFGGLKTILQTEGFRVSKYIFAIRFVN